MGKSRTVKKKRVVDMLLQKYPDSFTTSFEENKKILAELMVIPSKQVRNEIAGYLTRVMANMKTTQ